MRPRGEGGPAAGAASPGEEQRTGVHVLAGGAGQSRDRPGRESRPRTAAARASVMAIAQQQIHDAGGSAEFDLASFVRRLVPTLHARRLEIAVDAPDSVPVPLSSAVPLGLIVHELLTNAVHHAFPGDAEGRVVVTVRRKRDGLLCITVRDNGIGLPAGADLDKHRSAGLTIVKSLARQLGATLSLEPGPGTSVCLKLPSRGH